MPLDFLLVYSVYFLLFYSLLRGLQVVTVFQSSNRLDDVRCDVAWHGHRSTHTLRYHAHLQISAQTTKGSCSDEDGWHYGVGECWRRYVA